MAEGGGESVGSEGREGKDDAVEEGEGLARDIENVGEGRGEDGGGEEGGGGGERRMSRRVCRVLKRARMAGSCL